MFSSFSTKLKSAGILCLVFTSASIARAQSITVSTFASGTAVHATGPDSITVGSEAVWVSYTNGADSTGKLGSSTVVQYDHRGNVLHTYEIAGSVDGLKIDAQAGVVWAMQNQDGNSTLTLIRPATGITANSPLAYAVTSPTRGYDDVVFPPDGQIFLSYTNPVGADSPTIQRLVNRTSPLQVEPILTKGATGLNIATGQTGQPTTQNDPDSLKLTPGGELMLTSGDDGQLIFVADPGKSNQRVAFLNVVSPDLSPTSGLDDAVFATATSGTFYLTDTGNNRVLTIHAKDLQPGSLYACVGSLNELALVDIRSGIATPLVSDLNKPHGLVFVANQR